MKVIPKLQQGNTIESDNTKVVRPEIHEPIKAKPKQYSIVDLGGEPSNDTRSAAERNRDYWHPIKGAKARFRASMSNETNPLVGIERTILPSAAGAALVTTPAAVVGGALGNMTVDKLTGGWGNWLEDKTGIPSEIGIYTNPGAWYGGAKGYKIGKNKLITKSIKGDADLAWNPINKNHWIFNKEARTPSNIAMATANRITPFLSKVEKLPLKVAAYKAAKRTNGNASVSLQDMWKFNPADYAKRWNDSPNTANQVRLIKQAALMDKVGRPFILQQSNPIWIEGKSVRNPELVTMAHGGRFDFKKSPLLKKQEEINGKRDMRKKFIKSSRPTYKKRIKKAQQGMRFVSYNPVSNPTIDYTDITNPINPFSEYNYNTTYDKPEALVVPVRDTNEPDVVANNPTVEPVINKPVASKVTYTPKSYKGLAAFNKAYDEVEASNPEAKKYRQFLTKMAEQESGFNSAIQNRAGAPAYGYFQFMQDDKKYNNIRQYAGTDIETFRNNPKLQIEAAIRLAKSFEKGFSKEDLELANKNGYSTWGLLGGAWLAGNGGVRKFLRGQGNPSDRHWSKEGKGTDVATRIKAFNFKEGGIVKYQNPPHGIARRDAIQDYRPEIPFSPIKQPVKPYMPTQQPVLSSDNRTGWEKEVSRQIKADKAKNDKLYGNQHTWNWSAPFTNARITKDNASAIFDFDKSAAMSTFAIGQGIASPVTTATSIAGSLVGAGIGNKVAGEKGALVGGFVGGMVNPRFRFGKSSSTKRREHGNVADNVNLHSKMNFDDYDQIVNAIDNEEELYRLYLQNETVAKRIREVSPSYVKEVNNFIKTKIKKRFGKPTNGNYQAANRVADDAPEVTFGGVPFKYQENVYNIEPGKPIPHLEFVAHENSHGIDRAVSRLLSTDYLRNLLNPSDKLPFNKWINEVKKSKAVVDYIKRSRNLDVNNPADYSKIEKEVYKYFSDPTEIKAYFSRIPFEKYKKSVDRSFDGKVINNPVSKDIFQITDADILDDVRLQLIASIYKRNDMASYEALKSNLTNKLWGVSALGIPAINTLINGYE